MNWTRFPQSDLDRYGDTPFGRGALMAKRLVGEGVRFVQINRGGFDTHGDNFFRMREHGEVMDPALGSLLEDLAETGMLEKTMVVMMSEFGRTPRINEGAGRDHWPKVFSCFMAGGGIERRQRDRFQRRRRRDAEGQSGQSPGYPRLDLPCSGHRPRQGSLHATRSADEAG